MEEYTWKRFRWRMERRHARRSLLKFLFLFLALCVVLDVWGPGQIALMALLGLFVLWLLARYLRVRNEGLDGDADQLIYFDLLGRMKALPYSQIGMSRAVFTPARGRILRSRCFSTSRATGRTSSSSARRR